MISRKRQIFIDDFLTFFTLSYLYLFEIIHIVFRFKPLYEITISYIQEDTKGQKFTIFSFTNLVNDYINTAGSIAIELKMIFIINLLVYDI